jgi:hypothetical protein
MGEREMTENEDRAYNRGVVAGIAIACGIVYSDFGEGGCVEGVLRATDLDTRKKLKIGGATDYDIKLIAPVLKTLAR